MVSTDIEKSFIRHLVKLESFNEIWNKGVRSEHFFDEAVRELFDYSLQYYIRSEFKQTVTKEFLETKFEDYFKRHDWPDEEYLVGVLIEELMTKYRKAMTQSVLLKAASELEKDPEMGISLALGSLTKIQSDTSTRERIEIYGEGYERRINEYIEDSVSRAHEKRGIYFG